jgi:hypothetical protein
LASSDRKVEVVTTAASTGFAIESVEFLNEILYFDGNQKITADNGTFEAPAANAFSLPHITACPFRTPTCESSCYVENLEKYQSEIYEHYKSNLSTIMRLLSGSDSKFTASAFIVADWIAQNAKGGFRWHVSGDIFSRRYANWISLVASESKPVKHWIYTRSFPYLEPLLDVPNIAVNLSADRDNYWLARRYADAYDLRVCYLTVDGGVPDDMRDGDVIFPDYGLRGVGMKPHTYRDGSKWWQSLDSEQRKMVCPVDAYGKSEQVRCGPCSKCLKP